MLSIMWTAAFNNRRIGDVCLLIGASVLAFKPLVWLVGTWLRPGYETAGWLAALLTLALVTWSYRSPVVRETSVSFNPLWVLIATAGLRLSAQILAIDTIGAFLLCIDVYAIGHLLKLSQRQRPLSPVWLGLLFLFALPIEPILQRIVGYGLQLLSADLACGLLGVFVTDLTCSGVRLIASGKDVLVDLPCSGAELLSIVGLSLAAINAMTRPNLVSSVISIFAAAVIALVFNAVRITILGLGIAYEDTLSFSVIDEGPHTAIGLVTTALAVFSLASITRYYVIQRQSVGSRPTRHPGVFVSVLFLAFALSVSAFQPRPVDASQRLPSLSATRVAADFLATPVSLSTDEERYFEIYGGSASKVVYGPFSLLTVTTSSPLRHLHDPAICLRANGYDVELQGLDFSVGGTVYRATSDEEAYEVRVSYLSSSGQSAHSIGEVVWHWLQSPRERWTMVQRIIPIGLDGSDWDRAILRSLNIPIST